MNLKVVSVGADPEVICMDMSGKVKSVINHLGGSKEEPRPVKGGAVQEDNVLAEFNIEPANCASSFDRGISTVMHEMSKLLPHFQLSKLASAHFDMDELFDGGEKALSFGCSPDMNVYTMEYNRISEEVHPELRTAGGHVHVGLNEVANDHVINSVKMLDLFLGIPSVLFDQDRERKELYGKAGSFRFKDYGLEYRTLSNFWIFEEILRKWVYENTCRAIENVCNITNLFKKVGGEEVARTTINEGDKDRAHSIINEIGIPIPRMG